MPEHTPAPTPARSLYGFFMFLFSKTLLAIFCIWSLTPNDYLHYLNIYYYPQKYWATAIPIQSLVGLTMFAFLVYPSYNFMLTCKINSTKTISDSFTVTCTNIKKLTYTPSNKCICMKSTKCFKHNYLATSKELKENTVPQLYDLDIRFVSKKLYLGTKK